MEVTLWGTNVMFSGAASGAIKYVPKYEVNFYDAVYSTGMDKEIAKQVMARVVGLVVANITGGFLKSDKMDKNFVDYKVVRWEWDSDRFADVQKRPTVLIGVRKDIHNKYTVVLSIGEPYFKNQFKY